MNMLTYPGSDLAYMRALQAMKDAKIDQQMAVASQGYIRSEMLISANVTQYPIPMLITDGGGNGGAPFNTEKRLTLQDAIVVSELFIGLGVPSSANDATFELLTFPDPIKFSTAGAAASTQTLYAGYLAAMVNNNNIVPQWDIWRHFSRQRTQDGVGVTAQTVFPGNSTNGASDGFYPVAPQLINVGSKNIKWTINLPQAIATVQANSRIVFIQRGLILQNSTTVS